MAGEKLASVYRFASYRSSSEAQFSIQSFCPKKKYSHFVIGQMKFRPFLVLFLWSSCFELVKICSSTENGVFRCSERERDALVAFKNGLIDPSGRLSSWVGGDCCIWRGIECDNRTERVTKIDLRNPFRSRDSVSEDEALKKKRCLGGKISSSLLQLEYLDHLDLSLNCFRGIAIPLFFGMFRNLKYLNLASCSFAGEIPPHLGNLSSLQYLDLYENFDLRSKSLRWLSGLSSLTHLNLGRVNLYETDKDWLQWINQLPSLLQLNLYNCDMEDSNLDLPFVNFTSVVSLNMSENFFKDSFPRWLVNLTSLEVLDLGLNYLTGPVPTPFSSFCNLRALELSGNDFNIGLQQFLNLFSGCDNPRLEWLRVRASKLVGNLPESLGLLKNLQFLDLSGNSFWGSIPSSVGSLSLLKTMDLSENDMNGTVPESLGKLSDLVVLDLHSNRWKDTLTEKHFSNLTRLKRIELSADDPVMALVLNVTYDWVPPFKLEYIQIKNCLVGPMFGVWLQSQSLLTYVVLRNTGITDAIPKEWFLRIASRLTYLDLSNNQIKGELPGSLVSPNLTFIDLSYNRFEGSIPFWSTNAGLFNLRGNLLSGPIPYKIGELMQSLYKLDFSDNLLNGSIPISVCDLKSLSVLSLRSNRFSGLLPDCWEKLQKLNILDISNNTFSGELPRSIWSLTVLALMLGNNNFSGEILSFPQNRVSFMVLDLVGNSFSGEIPSWIGESFSSLLVLLLGSNAFTGKIPPTLCNLPYLHFLDLSHNNLLGDIPKCLGNLSALVNGSYDIFHDVQRYFGINYDGHVIIRTKDREFEYSQTLSFVNGIDLSGNNLSGSIPTGITSLSLISILNLSRNHLSGSIPREIGRMTSLETLDFSRNNLSGAIPQSLSNLTFLTHLDLSYNNFTGRIPSGNQLQTLNSSSIYEGNPLLCGPSLPTSCPGDKTATNLTPSINSVADENNGDDNDKLWFYIGLVVGFLVGLWGFYITLMINKTWRQHYFGFLDRLWERVAALTMSKLFCRR